MITATAEQCRRALVRLSKITAPRTMKMAGLALLGVLGDDGRRCPRWDDAPDYEAGALMRIYAATSLAFRKKHPGKKIAAHVVFNEHGVVPA